MSAMSWCDEDDQTFCNIGERDIDFLLLEELRCSHGFRERFLHGALHMMGIAEVPPAGAVFHSVHRTGLSTGETDLMVEFDATSARGTGKHAVLIEDKIDAPFSDRTKCGSKQTDRYREEIVKNTASGKWVAAVVLLVAPKAYVATVSEGSFDVTVSYENISEWLEAAPIGDSGDLAARLDHRRQMIRAAILRLRRGWERQPDPQVGSIWRVYHQIASSDYPDLCMNYRGGQPPDSYTVSFDCLPRVDGLRKCRIDHVMERGTVDILVPDYAARLTEIGEALARALGDGMSLRRAGKSLGINIKVTEVRRFESAESQTPTVREALEAVRRLKRWFEANHPVFLRS